MILIKILNKKIKNVVDQIAILNKNYFMKNLVNSSLVAAKDKYMSDKYLKVAELIEEN